MTTEQEQQENGLFIQSQDDLTKEIWKILREGFLK